MSVEDFKYNEKAGDVGTINYTLKLKEYRPVQPRQVNVTIQKQVVMPTAPRPNPKPAQKTYTVVSGDYLIKIARKLGISDWRTIYNLNKDQIKDPNVIWPGMVLKIP